MDMNNESKPYKVASSALAWVLILMATAIVGGVLCFYFLWTQAEKERDAQYKQGWDYGGASQVLKMAPHEPSAHIAMASVWMKQKQYNKAVAEYNQAVKLEPRNPYDHLELGDALNQLGQIAGARKEWHTAAVIDVPGGQAAIGAIRRLNSK